jgi:hypothetical protein|tara:strand:+ start:3599 stop:4117 length:519 start_codon:yes stop_codon:yes gene_type:complete
MGIKGRSEGASTGRYISMSEKKIPVGKPFVKNDPRINRAGRRLGSRNKFSNAFVDAMLMDFELHGEAVIAEVRERDPSTYVRIATALIPSKSETEVEVKDNTSELIEAVDWEAIMGIKDASEESQRGLQMGESGEDVPIKDAGPETGGGGIRQRLQEEDPPEEGLITSKARH